MGAISQYPTTWTIGVAALGKIWDGPVRITRPDLCAEYGHPGCTYHPQMDKTWCLCGAIIRDGNHHTHAACCGGPLEELVPGKTDSSEAAA